MALFWSLFTGVSFLVGFLKNEILGFDENLGVDLQQGRFTRPICDLVVGRQVTAVDARHKLTRCLHDRHRQGQATSIDLDNRSFTLACLPLLAGTDRRRQTA